MHIKQQLLFLHDSHKIIAKGFTFIALFARN